MLVISSGCSRGPGKAAAEQCIMVDMLRGCLVWWHHHGAIRVTAEDGGGCDGGGHHTNAGLEGC